MPDRAVYLWGAVIVALFLIGVWLVGPVDPAPIASVSPIPATVAPNATVWVTPAH